jgi:holin-like protein
MAAPDNLPINIIQAAGILLGCQLVGEAVVTVARQFFPFVAFPGPVVGMALLFAFLVWRRGPDRDLEATGLGILRNLSLLFVPATVGFIQHGEILARYGLIVITALLISAALTLTVTALTFQAIAKWQGIDDDDQL